MVDKLTKYEVALFNKVISKTTESASFNVFDILKKLSEQTSYFDKRHYSYSDQDAERITNFLLDKKFVKQVHTDKPAFEQVVRWTDKGVQLKKRNNYNLYRIRDEIMPDTGKILAWVVGLLTIVSMICAAIIYLCSKTK